ncbi:MAG: hypothetical protein IPH07_28160 [Deltaproteobacteria bacterium]|nr:hypothetical protein [Deltaproteobacteria bacterium]MBK8714774.1 hypothetical protein [Deltaproteobacteria bacterium]MBP7289551.1 hypothetical protein [Nannocystaceae bacterium]
MARRRRVSLLWLVLLSCAGGSKPGVGTKRPEILGDRCDMAAKQAAPLIVDWSSQARSRLEAAVRSGPVVPVRVSDCEIEPLWQCQLPASYAYQPSSVRREAEHIADRNALFARIPTTAVSLEATIAAGSELQVDKTTVGRFALPTLALAENQLVGQCTGATHFISAVDVGAFEFSSGRKLDADAKVTVGNAGGGISHGSEHQVLAADGELQRCADEAGDAAAPREGCRAPIQIDLTPLQPSLTKDEFLAIGVKGSQLAFDTCHVGKQLGGRSGVNLLVYVIAEPSGSLSLRYPGPPPEPAYDDCLRSVWSSLRVEPFTGPALVLEAMVYDLSVQPGEGREQVHAAIRRSYLDNFSRAEPGIPPRTIGEQIHYDYARNGVTATDAWQPR